MSSEAIELDAHLFASGPPLRLQRSIGLVKPDQLRVGRRAVIAALIAWVPLAVLTTAQTLLFSRPTAKVFLADLSVHARYLIAIPALILAEADLIPRLEGVVRHFVDSGMVAGSDIPRYRLAVLSTRRLLDSKFGELIALFVAYALVLAVVFYPTREALPEWQRAADGNLSLVGWWHMVISLPLLLILLCGWLWRLALWGRFLFLMAKLDLRLLPSHPDCVGGLKFVSTSLRGFRWISFGLSAIVAGSIAERVLYHEASLSSYRKLAIALVVFILVLSAGPLTIFVHKLREAKKRGIFEYGALANRLGREFESKWLNSTPAQQDMLEAPDFSATIDYYAVAANVYEMRDLPFNLKDLIAPVAPAAVPFIIVALLTIPVQVVVDTLIKLLI